MDSVLFSGEVARLRRLVLGEVVVKVFAEGLVKIVFVEGVVVVLVSVAPRGRDVCGVAALAVAAAVGNNSSGGPS